MKSTNRTVVLLLSGLSIICGATAVAQDWPQWRGENRDARVVGFKVPKTWPKELVQKWKIVVGTGDATPALVGDKLYVFSRQEGEEVVRCLEAASGKEVWADKYTADAVGGPDSQHGGPRSSPVVSSGKVVTLGVCGAVSCLDAGTGKVIWRKTDFPGAWPRFHTAMSPLVVNDLSVVQLGKEGDGAIIGYALADGQQKWKWSGEGPGYASPVLIKVGDADVIVTETTKSIIGLSPTDGQLLWQESYAPQGMAYNAATPIVHGQTLIFCGQGRGARAVRLEKQGQTISAKELWNNPENSVQFNTPVVKNDLLFGLSQRGNFFCLNTDTGKTAWTDPVGSRGSFGSIIDAGPVLVALNSKSQLTVFEPSAAQYSELAAIKVSEKQTYAYPVLAGNRLFVKDQDSLTLWSIE